MDRTAPLTPCIVERAIIAELMATETPLSDWEIELLDMEQATNVTPIED